MVTLMTSGGASIVVTLGPAQNQSNTFSVVAGPVASFAISGDELMKVFRV